MFFGLNSYTLPPRNIKNHSSSHQLDATRFGSPHLHKHFLTWFGGHGRNRTTKFAQNIFRVFGLSPGRTPDNPINVWGQNFLKPPIFVGPLNIGGRARWPSGQNFAQKMCPRWILSEQNLEIFAGGQISNLSKNCQLRWGQMDIWTIFDL